MPEFSWSLIYSKLARLTDILQQQGYEEGSEKLDLQFFSSEEKNSEFMRFMRALQNDVSALRVRICRVDYLGQYSE